MRKAMVILAISVSLIAQAKVLRVNNVAGMAPYQQINAAVSAANAGDTIMVDGSSVNYEGATISKRLTVIGPGYLLRENSISTATQQPASIEGISVEAEGVTLVGLRVCGLFNFVIKSPKAIVTRCMIDCQGLRLEEGASNCIIHQNFFCEYNSVSADDSFNHQVTNNIFVRGDVSSFRNSYIAYNTFCNNGELSTYRNEGCTIEKNIVFGWEDSNWRNNSTYTDNYVFADGTYLNDWYPTTDKQVQERTPAAAQAYGAFAGDDPYRLSGVPAAPVIEQLTVPASVEEGSPLNVTIKLGLQQ